MKVKTISRNEEFFIKARQSNIPKVFRNHQSTLHPFHKGRELVRATVAVKLERLLSKPFLGALDGHADGVYAMTTVPTSLTTIVSGAGDGELRTWHLPSRRIRWAVRGHSGRVGGVACSKNMLISCGLDKLIKVWSLEQVVADSVSNSSFNTADIQPYLVQMGARPFTGVDHHCSKDMYATSSTQVDLWDYNRSEPIQTLAWNGETMRSVKFNLVETNILVSTALDRSIVLYDVRASTPIRKLVTKACSNAVCWNPMEAYFFSSANDDSNCYTYDCRKLKDAVCVHQGFQNAVMSVDYSPTGRELACGAYDKTIRIFPVDSTVSREIYHTRRMQRVFSVKYTRDSAYLLSGSDDSNLRLWKTVASKPLRKLTQREERKINYLNKLKQRFGHIRSIRSIMNHRHVPRSLYVQQRTSAVQTEAEKNRVYRTLLARSRGPPIANSLRAHIVTTEE